MDREVPGSLTPLKSQARKDSAARTPISLVAIIGIRKSPLSVREMPIAGACRAKRAGFQRSAPDAK